VRQLAAPDRRHARRMRLLVFERYREASAGVAHEA
jgi:hypothetical protein